MRQGCLPQCACSARSVAHQQSIAWYGQNDRFRDAAEEKLSDPTSTAGAEDHEIGAVLQRVVVHHDIRRTEGNEPVHIMPRIAEEVRAFLSRGLLPLLPVAVRVG